MPERKFTTAFIDGRPCGGYLTWPGAVLVLAGLAMLVSGFLLLAGASTRPAAARPISELIPPALRLVAGGADTEAGETAVNSSQPEPVASFAPGFAGAQQPYTAAPSALAVAAPIGAASHSYDPVERWRQEGFILVIQGQEWDAASFAAVDEALGLLPARVRSQLGNRALGPVFISVNKAGRTPSGQQPYGGAANFFSTNAGRNDLVLFPAQSALTVLHELGHAFNLRNAPAAGYASVLLEEELQSFMAAAGWRVLTLVEQLRGLRDQTQAQYAYDGAAIWPRLSRNDPLEDFANSFALYFARPDSLRQLSPARYDWFARYVGR